MGAVPEAQKVVHPTTDKKLSPELTLGARAEWARLARGLTEPLFRKTASTRTTIFCSTSADGSARLILILLLLQIGPELWQRKLLPLSVSGPAATGAALTPRI
jgi:hypothetical protein